MWLSEKERGERERKRERENKRERKRRERETTPVCTFVLPFGDSFRSCHSETLLKTQGCDIRQKREGDGERGRGRKTAGARKSEI